MRPLFLVQDVLDHEAKPMILSFAHVKVMFFIFLYRRIP